jgi:ABC-type uncharacterized transport system involved in gliding motility auxiliary subunit
MNFDWSLFWQQTVNQLWVALVMVPVCIVAFALVYWLKRRR